MEEALITCTLKFLDGLDYTDAYQVTQFTKHYNFSNFGERQCVQRTNRVIMLLVHAHNQDFEMF